MALTRSKIKRSESECSHSSERVQIAPRRLDGNRAECVSTKRNACAERSICVADGNASEVTILGAAQSTLVAARQHFECERREHISIARFASKYRVAKQHIDILKGRNYTPCELTAVAVALRASSSYNEGSRSNLHSLADKRACRLASFDFRVAKQHILIPLPSRRSSRKRPAECFLGFLTS